ncbi:hypothetical protein [Paenibacillus segetis]|uniref:Replicative helicase inhibitor G39P N-terminal domain-containing protein n=1 Tax=Paenibacillus segetis TaxID=1325360 RepID=A0ABQ1Y8U7_9BACL|nr:hypothetical protein [Paenibacillus segetis]GGH17097.1 hypothetical protein GCM10008013_12250 [Paenibacillus segetis]
MEVVDIAELYRHIKKYYPAFDASLERVKEDHKYLWDFPKEVAQENVDGHIRTSKFPPNIAEIRGSLGEQIERDRMKDATAEYFAERERARAEACPPPPGWKEAIYAKLGRS